MALTRRLPILLAAPLAALLTSCAPDVPTRMLDLYLYGVINARLTYFYGGPREFTYQGNTVVLSEPDPDDRRQAISYAVPGALLVDTTPFLRLSLRPLAAPIVTASRIPLTTDMQVATTQAVGEVVYFDGTGYLELLAESAAGIQQRVVPRPRLNRLRGLGELTNAEADALAASFEARGQPFVVAVLPVDELPVRTVDGLEEYRRTGLYVQTEVGTDQQAFRPSAEQLVWETLASGTQASGFPNARYEMVQTQDQLITLWNRVQSHLLQPPPVPAVDVARETVVGIFLGQRNTGGYSVTVRRVVEEEGELYVEVEVSEPGPGAIVSQAITSPWTLVRILRTGYQVAWIRNADDGTLIGAARVLDF